jgi:integrase
MSIYAEKRGGRATGRHVVEVQRDGKRHKVVADSVREAKRLQAALQNGLTVTRDRKVGAYALSDLARDSRGLWAGSKDGSNSLRRLEVCVEVLGPTVRLDALQTRDIDRLIEALRERGLGGATINRHTASLSKALKWAHKRSLIEALPHIAHQPEGKPRDVWLTPGDEDRLVIQLEAQDDHEVALIVRILCQTGIRIGELLKLTPDDVHADQVYLEDRKNGENALQPLSRPLAGLLRALVESGLPTYPQIQTAFYRARDALGMDPELTLHSLRHTTATRLAMRGASAVQIMSYLGHKSFNTTKRYTHLNIDAKRDALRLLVGG